MLKAKALRTANIYVPTKRRTTLDSVKVAEIAESILQQCYVSCRHPSR
jgi:hypothetical protein